MRGADFSVTSVDRLRDQFRSRGMRWTPQRRTIVSVISAAPDHVRGSELVERCRAVDPETTASTVYRTLAVLEDLGLVSHAHGLDGREEYHVRPGAEHAHLICASCGTREELGAVEAARLLRGVAQAHRFTLDLSHLTLVGECADCSRSGSTAT